MGGAQDWDFCRAHGVFGGTSPHLAVRVCWEWAVVARLLSYKAGLLLLKGWFILNLLPGGYWFMILCFLGPLVSGSQWGLSPPGTSLPLSLV